MIKIVGMSMSKEDEKKNSNLIAVLRNLQVCHLGENLLPDKPAALGRCVFL